jgi:hypothetical protein
MCPGNSLATTRIMRSANLQQEQYWTILTTRTILNNIDNWMQPYSWSSRWKFEADHPLIILLTHSSLSLALS